MSIILTAMNRLDYRLWSLHVLESRYITIYSLFPLLRSIHTLPSFHSLNSAVNKRSDDKKSMHRAVKEPLITIESLLTNFGQLML
jgi:hypothetical protein